MADGHHYYRNLADVFGPSWRAKLPCIFEWPRGDGSGVCCLALCRSKLRGGYRLHRRLPPEKCAYAIYFNSHQVADRPSRWHRLLAVWNCEQRDQADGDICHWVLHTGADRLTLFLEANN